jgi:RNA polymerase sigma-70 factor (ECF subfamily)
MVYSLSLSIVRNVSDAEEVTQDVFLRIWNNAEHYDLELGSVAGWLSVITRRLAIDRTRSRMYRAGTREIEPTSETEFGSVSASTVSGQAEGREVLEALGKLESRHREIIRLSYFEGLSHSRIADRLSTPLGTVKTRLREAINHLRTIMKVEANER